MKTVRLNDTCADSPQGASTTDWNVLPLGHSPPSLTGPLADSSIIFQVLKVLASVRADVGSLILVTQELMQNPPKE